MRQRFIYLLTVFVFFFAMFAIPRVIRAQSDEVQATAAVVQVESSTAIDEQRQQLKDTYRTQILEYQKLYREFSLSKAEFEQLQTLASLEKAVTSTRDVFRARDELLITYVQQLAFELAASPNYTDANTIAVTNQLQQLEQDLNAHLQLVINSQDRQALTERADSFVALADSLQALSAQTRIAILLGRFRASAGLVQQLTADVKQAHLDNPVSAIDQGERQRAYQELSTVEASVQTAWSKSTKIYDDAEKFSAGTYTDFVVSLGPVQSGLLRWYTLLEEAAQL